MDKLFKISIIVACLLAGFGVFYHYVIYLPDMEERRIARERTEKEEAARQAEAERIEAAKRAAIERAEATLRAEAERAEAAKRAEIAKHQAALRNLERKAAYYDCLTSARKAYEVDWANACKSNAKFRSARLKDCLETPGMGERFCHSTFGNADPNPKCSLPSSLADDITKQHDKAKQQCLAEVKLF